MAVKQNNGYSFTFKKTVVKKLSQPGFNESDSEDDEFSLASKRTCFRLQLEDRQMKSKRLKEEGSILAEAGRYWEAVSKWNEAIEINPESAVLYEMKSQALLELDQVFPAVKAAQKAVELNPIWPEGRQTLGRAQLGLGELDMALRNFEKALHLDPSNTELRNDDLQWTWELKQKRKEISKQ